MLHLTIFVVAAIAVFLLTPLIRAHAVRAGMLDVPNHRSAHSTPTPRGGGLSIVIVAGLGVIVLSFAGLVPPALAAAFVGGGGLIATVGWLDDRFGIPAMTRLMVHLLAGIWAVYCLGELTTVQIGERSVHLPGGFALTVLGIVWFVNLYNFMDGIDGLAASQAIAAGIAAAAILLLRGNPATAAIAVVVAGASAGFLPWNFPRARIFMGDVGSGFLGFVFGVLAVVSEREASLPLIAWLMILGVFVFDATVTLFRRFAGRRDWASPHSDHAYQRLVRRGWSHSRTTAAAFVVAVFLSALAAAGTTRPVIMPLVLAFSVLALTLFYLKLEKVQPMSPRVPPRDSR